MSERASQSLRTSGARIPVHAGAAGVASRASGRLSAALAAALVLLAASPAGAAPLAGTSIVNTASGSGVYAPGGQPFALPSNTTRAVVQPLEALQLVAPGGASARPGTTASFRHRLTNLGNDLFTFRVDAANLAGDGFDLAAFTVVRDLDGDGVADPGEPVVPPGGSLALAAGGAADLVLVADVPGGAPAGSRALAALTATGLAQGTVAVVVDTVATPAATPPTLAFFGGPTYAQAIQFGAPGAPLWLQAVALDCDARPTVRDTIALTVTSSRGVDLENVIAVESGPSTGVFRIAPALPTTAGSLGTSSSNDAVLSLARGDVVTATLVGCGAPRTEATLWIEPSGVVFDAQSGAPVAGASVTLIDVTGDGNGGLPGAPARVFTYDGVTPAANPVTSDAGGRFAFPLAAASTYRVDVAPPGGFRFPSLVPPGGLPGGMLIDPAGSYGGAFVATDPLGPIVLDVPLDFASGDVLFVETDALRPLAELGDAVDFAVRVANRSSVLIDSVIVVDRLPFGFAFVAGTLRLAGAASTGGASASATGRLIGPASAGAPVGRLAADREITPLPGGGGRDLSFAVGALAPGEVIELRFRTRVGAGANDGDRVNHAYAYARGVTSNRATAAVTITAGPFAVEGTILGTVFVDVDGDLRPGPGDPALPGVRLYLDDGTFVVTDADGRYSLYGLAPRTRALKLDAMTLPAGARPVATDVRDAGTPGLRFVDLTLGDLQRADFPVVGDSALAGAARARLVAQAAAGRGELARAMTRGGDALAPTAPVRDPRALPAEGISTGEARLPLFRSAPASLSAARRADGGGGLLEERLLGLGAELGFVDFAAVDTVGLEQVTVRVKGALASTFRLEVNGTAIADSRVGKKLAAPEAGVEAWEFVGVRLRPGVNALRLTTTGGAGPVTIALVAPDRAARLVLDAPAAVPADGYTPAAVTLRLTDAAGVPVAARTLVTLEATLGRLVADDLDPTTAGTQVALEGGQATIDLFAQGTPGDAELTARAASGLEATARVRFAPDLRPTIAVGAIEGLVSLSGYAGRRAPADVMPKPLFEAEPVAFVSQSRDGDALAAIRGSAFYKGKVKDDLLLTLGYDSERADHVRAFRDLTPDAYYPLYGDASVRGFEAQSTRPLYARLDRRGASLLYGDFVTPGAGGARTLSAYSRSLNGAVGRFEDAKVRFAGWSSRERSRRQVDEIRGRGVSGPYALSIAPLVDGSERIEVIVRDRDQPAVVVSSGARQRFVDYTIDATSGEILLKAPLPSVDADLNPVSLRVTYEVEDGGPAYWTTGFEARIKAGAKLEVGGSYVDDHDPSGGHEIRSVFAAAKTGARSTLEGEFATTNAAGTGARDVGGRLEWRHAATGVEARAYAAATGDEYANPTSGYAAGRVEAGGRVSAVLSPRSRLLGEALYSGDTTGGERRGGVMVALDRTLSPTLRAELGTRLAAGRDAAGEAQPFAATVRAKLLARVPAARELDAWLELEQDMHEFDRRLVAVGGEMRVLPRVRAYGRHEFIGGRLDPWALAGARQSHRTAFGFDANVSPEARVFSEYRIDGAIGGRDAEAVVGLRNAWRLAGGARVTGSFERVQPIGPEPTTGTLPGASLAFAVGVDYADSPWWKGSARTEIRTSRASDGLLTTLAGALRIDRTWSALARNHLSLMRETGGRRNDRERLQLGVAYRSGAAWDALGRYEFHWDRDGGGAPAAGELASTDLHRIAHVISLHGAGPLAGRTTGALAWAGKRVEERTDGIATSTSAHWIHGRAAWALGAKYDAGLLASAWSATHSRRGGLGVEVGRRLDRALWLSLGFNRFGYSDDELTGEEYTRQGAYLRLRARFDESLLGLGGGTP